MSYKEMLENAKAKGMTNEKMMWDSIDNLSGMLLLMEKEHPKEYWRFMRKQHGIIYNNHYEKEFAEWDVSQIEYTNKEGTKKYGAYWTVEQIESATMGMKFPNGTTKWDKYVAFNVAHSDFCKKFDDEQILDIAFSFFFADEDWGSTTKVWEYMKCKNS